VTGESEDVRAVFFAVDETRADEVLRVLAQRRLRRKIDFGRIHDRLVFEDLLLALIVPEWLLSINTLVENDANGPDIHSIVDDRRASVWPREALRRKIPVCSRALRSQLNAAILLVAVEDLLRQAEIRNFYISTNGAICEEHISWL